MSFRLGVLILIQVFIFSSIQAALSKRETELINHVIQSIEKAEKGVSKLNSQVMTIHGMSSPKVRHFLNNICSLPNTAYLEVGSWKGSTLVSALYKNEASVINAIGIDNWSEFDGPRNEFVHNIQTFVPDSNLRFYETNCFDIDRSVFDIPITIYFYDGHHSYENQEKAFIYFDSVLNDSFIAIVDDWNWGDVRSGTLVAFRKLGYEVLYQRSLYTNANGDMDSWWNGLYVAVIRKCSS